MTRLLDYSAGKISGAAIKNAGFGGAIRYITDRTNLATKHTNPAEYADHVANGLDIWLVYEVGTNDPLGGYAGGVTAAQRALDGASFIGYPSDRHIFVAFDRHAQASELPAWKAYLDGAASVLGIGRTGAYGFSEAVDAAQGHATAFWQCGSASAVRNFTNVYQRNVGSVVVGGISCDINDVFIPLPVGGGSSTGGSAPIKEFDMPDRELHPSTNGSVTLTVPPDGDELVIGIGWTSLTVTKVGFFGPTPPTGPNQLWATSGAQRVDAGRPWRIPLAPVRAAGEAITCEVDFVLAPVAGRDVTGTAGFRKYAA